MAKLTGHTFDFDSEGFTLRDIMKAPLLRYKEDIEASFWFIFYCKFADTSKNFVFTIIC